MNGEAPDLGQELNSCSADCVALAIDVKVLSQESMNHRSM